MWSLLPRFEHLPAWLVTLLSLLGVALIGLADYRSGVELSFAAFYLLPVSMAAWAAGRGSGVLISLASAATWHAVNLLGGGAWSSQWIPWWNTATRLAIFVVVALLLADLRRALAHERALSRTDQLTGALNSRAFYEQLALERGRRRPFCLVYLDLDDFKRINDTQGHSRGDQLLTTLTHAVQAQLRCGDLLARLGGDEFALLLAGADRAAGLEVVERLRGSLQQRHDTQGLALSIGLLPVEAAEAADSDELIRRADQLMYTAKSRGKNQIVIEAGPGEAA